MGDEAGPLGGALNGLDCNRAAFLSEGVFNDVEVWGEVSALAGVGAH